MKLTLITTLTLAGAVSGVQLPLLGPKAYPQEMHDNENPLKYVSTNGPYVDRRSYGIAREPPESCSVDQMVMIMRHGERYPSAKDAAKINKAIEKLYKGPKKLSGDLQFVNTWKNPFSNRCDYALETFSGPYAGRADAFMRGAQYRGRYNHLLSEESKKTVVPFFATGFQRVIETARMFGQGFFGYEYSNVSALNIIPEDDDRGGDSLTPWCYANDTVDMDKIQHQIERFPQFKVAAERFNSQNKGLNLKSHDIYWIMTGVGYELGIRPGTPWITAFTPDEWATFGYVSDVLYYYKDGPGNVNQVAAGSNFVNATVRALQSNSTAMKLIMNFSHHSQIIPMIAAFNIVNPDKDLPLTHPVYNSKWQISDIMPMGGLLVIERLACNETVISPEGQYVRFVLNEAVVPMEECQSGPGFTCPLTEWIDYYKKNSHNYAEECDLPEEYPKKLDFWWNANHTSEFNFRTGPISCGEEETDE